MNGYGYFAYGYPGYGPMPGSGAAGMPSVQGAVTGLLVGGTGAAAANIHAYRDGTKTRNEAVSDAVKVAVITGIATAAANAVSARVARPGVLPTLAAFATGTAVMYALTNNKSKTKEGEK